MNNIEQLELINIFDDAEYVIPIYQREFAWEYEQIEQLIVDINSFDNQNYYIGTLIVFKRSDGKFEVIDGQQRLTAIYILLSYLELEPKNLTFDCRDKSNKTLKNLSNLDKVEEVEINIKIGRDSVKAIFDKPDNQIDIEIFKDRLKNVILFRIEVPKNTDLNRYFETMNIRGEQLEQNEIVKALLMSKLTNDEQTAFAKIWNACSDMNSYIQMNFDEQERKILFGDNWNEIKFNETGIFKNFQVAALNDDSDEKTILEIINSPPSDENNLAASGESYNDDTRFRSIINFDFFLLHTLQVYVSLNKISAISVDDKKLLEQFKKLINADFSRKFIYYLLKCRFLFDKFIIKREHNYKNNSYDWTLQEVDKSTSGDYYKNTNFNNNEHKNILMIQSCLRVTYTSPQSMSWINKLLAWLFANDDINDYLKMIEDIAKVPIKEFIDSKNYSQGTATPHIIFNYLDYLLWKKNPNVNFNFEYRNSVEHWYPQNPPEGNKRWSADDENSFGNLCLITQSENSQLSNRMPKSKINDCAEICKKSSLKLREMAKVTDWDLNNCKVHHDDMIKLLSF